MEEGGSCFILVAHADHNKWEISNAHHGMMEPREKTKTPFFIFKAETLENDTPMFRSKSNDNPGY